MEKKLVEKISLWQLFVTIVLFNVGSAVVIGVGLDAGRDAWIAVLIATLIGMVLIRIYVFMLAGGNGENLFGIFEQLFGRFIAIILSLAYICYFLYISARVLRDFLELLITVILPNTPVEVISFVFMLTAAYIVYLGLEVLVRIGEVYAPYVVGSLILITIFLIGMGDVDINRGKPILAEGFTPVIDAIFPQLIGFPFGEAIVLTLLITITSNNKHVTKVTYGAVALSGIILAYHMWLVNAVLGADVTARVTFPLLSAARHISLFEFIERLDALVVFIMMIGIFFKVSIFFYGGLKGLEYVFKVPYRFYSVPIGIIVAFFANLMSSNFAEHIQEGLKFVPYYLHIPFQLVIPGLITLIFVLKKMKKKGKQRKEEGVNESSN